MAMMMDGIMKIYELMKVRNYIYLAKERVSSHDNFTYMKSKMVSYLSLRGPGS
jgi:hypothetical protein